MTTSKGRGACFTVTHAGHVVFIGITEERPSKSTFNRLCTSIHQRTHHNYKNLVWTPLTWPKPTKFRWKRKGGGYQGLNDRNLPIEDLNQI